MVKEIKLRELFDKNKNIVINTDRYRRLMRPNER